MSKAIFFKILILLISLLPLRSIAQEQLIKGVVIDVDNSFPLPGANIYWEGNKTAGVVSNLEGEFEISVVDLPAT